MSFTNTSPFSTPTRSKKAALGTNPLTVAAKGVGNDEFVLDMATTAVALGKVFSYWNLRLKITLKNSFGG